MNTNDSGRQQVGHINSGNQSSSSRNSSEAHISRAGQNIQNSMTMSHQFGAKNAHSTLIPPVSASPQDTIFVFLTLAFISVALYFTFILWRKLRERPLATLYKLEEYRYSRLSQNEMEVDSVVFYGDPLQPEPTSDDDEECKPATLHLETDSLIAMPSCKPSVTTTTTTATTPNATKIPGLDAQKAPIEPSQPQNNHSRTPTIQDSDEDLLQ